MTWKTRMEKISKDLNLQIEIGKNQNEFMWATIETDIVVHVVKPNLLR